MRYGIIIVTRDRLETLKKTLPTWAEQDLPVLILTEKGQVRAHNKLLEELHLPKKVFIVSGHPAANKGVGYARMRAVELADTFGVGAFIMADDDTKVRKGNVRCLLDFVAEQRGIICAGWMQNYGLWVPNGNEISKRPDAVIPCGGARDRVFAVNTQTAMSVGNFDPKLKTLDTQEMNRLGIKAGHLWWIHSGCHIAMVNKPHDAGGIQAQFETPEERIAQNIRDHEYVYKKWGPEYISKPPKRMSTRWLKLATDFIGPRAASAISAAEPYQAADVRDALRMFRR